MDNRIGGKKIAQKVLRYFPLRLRRVYMSRKKAEDMRCYIEKHVNDGILRRPIDS